MSIKEARPPRRLWPWVLIAVAAIVAVVVAVTFAVTRHADINDPQSGAPTSSTPTPIPSAADDVAPTGCLGGPGRDAAMVLAAQKTAPHTSNGAVEVATAIVRWLFQYPSPSASDIDGIASGVISSTAMDEFKDLSGAFESNPNNSGGAVADGTAYYLSTVPGVWHLESSSADDATVSIGAAFVVDGALSPQLRSTTTFDLTWESGSWHLASGSVARTTEELFQIGTAFTGGC